MQRLQFQTGQREIAPIDLPAAVCFRVTRFCNASCAFCLAPPDGEHPDANTLTGRLDWLLTRGVRVIHFCGGEPTIHPALAQLIDYVHSRGGRTRLTTNGIVIPSQLISVLHRQRTDVKVSLHGDRQYHDKMVGREAFDATTENIRRLIATAVPASVQTTVVSGGEWVVEWVANFCNRSGVRRLNILPFIPRGSGYRRRAEFELTTAERQSLREMVRRQRKAFSGRVEIKWLDFNASLVPVIEADGSFLLEGATESADRMICRIAPESVAAHDAESEKPNSLRLQRPHTWIGRSSHPR